VEAHQIPRCQAHFPRRHARHEKYLDWWSPGATGARRTRIDAVEIHAPCIGGLHRAVRDDVRVPFDAVDFLGACPSPVPGFVPDSWDLIRCIDMIERLDEEAGRRFIAAAMRRCKTLLVSTPMAPSPQGAVFGNEHERHVSRWMPADFEPFGALSGIGVGGFGW
jgi:hypothetical protein